MKKYLLLLIVIGTSLLSCKKFVNIDTPKDELASIAVFADSSTAEASIIGIYSNFFLTTNFLISGGFNIFTGLAGDDLLYTGVSSDISEIQNNSITRTNNYVHNNLWRYGYDYIYKANACLEGLAASTTLSTSQKNRLIGEAKFARAMVYYYLVNLFGDVPLELTTDYQVNQYMPRTTQDSIYAQIIKDLNDAKELLPVNYVTSDRTRPNKYSASAFLARIYLYKAQYAAAKTESDLVINSGEYSIADINNVFLKTSNETIFQFYPLGLSSVYNSVDGTFFIPNTSSTAKPTYSLSNYLIQSFQSEDLRKSLWMNKKTIGATTYTYAYKYKVRTSSTQTEYNIFFRLAECYLIRAEANCKMGNYDNAISDINIIRNRAGLDDFVQNSQSEIFNEIVNENRWEFFAEYGHRWADLKRWGVMDETLKVEKPNYQPMDSLFPIPYEEIKLNVHLTQNNGY